MKILITGAIGFIGYHLCKLLLDEDYNVLGIDNLNDFYEVKLKYDRLKRLKLHKNFNFVDVDISDKKSLADLFIKFKPEKVVNLAAQAGVRVSPEKHIKYLDSNLVGFLNIIEVSRQNNVKGFIYASSSSVYGLNNKIPFSINDATDKPISFYAASKKSNEIIAHSYSHLYGLNTTGLRYFTVYGPWGRPDMAYYIFTKNISEGRPINVFNNGNMKRDFTYIDDIVLGTKSAIEKNYPYELFNLGNQKSNSIMDIIKIIETELSIKAQINLLPMQAGDVIETCASISKSIKMLNYNPKISINEGMPKFINWYKNYVP